MELILKIRPADHEKESLRLFTQYFRYMQKRYWKKILTTYILYLSGGVLGLFLTSFFMRSGDVSRLFILFFLLFIIYYIAYILYYYTLHPQIFAKGMVASIKTMPSWNQLAIITINENGIEYKRGEDEVSRNSWESFTSLVSLKSGFVLAMGDVSRFLLNHELFSEEEKLTLLHLAKEKNISFRS